MNFICHEHKAFNLTSSHASFCHDHSHALCDVQLRRAKKNKNW